MEDTEDSSIYSEDYEHIQRVSKINSLKIISYNINGIKKHLTDISNVIRNHEPDVILLQKYRYITNLWL